MSNYGFTELAVGMVLVCCLYGPMLFDTKYHNQAIRDTDIQNGRDRPQGDDGVPPGLHGDN